MAPVELVAQGGDLADSAKAAAKCGYEVVGSKIVKNSGKRIWNKIKARKLPSARDVGSLVKDGVQDEIAHSNPLVAGGLIVGCTVLSPSPAE
jgi:hypothetical protein